MGNNFIIHRYKADYNDINVFSGDRNPFIILKQGNYKIIKTLYYSSEWQYIYLHDLKSTLFWFMIVFFSPEQYIVAYLFISVAKEMKSFPDDF